MTRTNQELLELPDHGHYPKCLQRKDEIDKNSMLVLRYTILVGVFSLLFTMCTFKLVVISWIPMLIGDTTDILALFVQILIVLMIPLAALMNCGKHKIFGMILFGFYIAQALFGFLNMKSNTADIFSFIFGLGGIITSFRTVSDYLDWNQLMETEGFPHFNLRVAEQLDNPEYVPIHKGENASAQMSEPEKVADMVFTQTETAMPGISMPKPAMKGDPDYVFRPAGGKHCSMSESPIKTA